MVTIEKYKLEQISEAKTKGKDNKKIAKKSGRKKQ